MTPALDTVREWRRWSSQRRGWRAVLVLGVLLAVIPWGARAQSCIAPAQGVPPAWVPPQWWGATDPMGCVGSADPACAADAASAIAAHCSTDSLPAYCSQLDSPQWEGAFAISKGDGTQETMVFLAVHDSTYLYLSWRYRGMPLGAVGQNVVYFGYKRASDGKPVIVSAPLAVLNQVQDGFSGFVTPQAFLLDTSSCVTVDSHGTVVPSSCRLGAALAPQPSWLNAFTRVWIDDPEANSYAVNMRVPLADIQGSGGTFKLWFEMLAGSPTTPVTSFVWPRTGADVIEGPAPTFDNCFPESGAWESFKLSTGPGDASCPAQGVSLDQSLLSTDNTPSHYLYWKLPPDSMPTNVIWARPSNQTGAAISAGTLMGKFRLANWGSNPSFEDWESGVSVDDLWHPIDCAEKVDSFGHVPNIGAIASGTTANAGNELKCSWTMTTAEAMQFQSGDRKEHQCILVEMSDAIGLVYANRSVWSNFEVREASTITERAELSVRKLKPIAADGRDLYVYVETLNMPSSSPALVCPEDQPGKGEKGTSERLVAVEPGGAPNRLQCAIAQGRLKAPDLARAIGNGQLSEAQLDAAVPTYRVRVYHDTGRTVRLAGKDRPVLNPQGSFGYRVVHAGALEGWSHALQFDPGWQVDELAPDFYRIRKVPNEGVVNVTTTIEAVEPKRFSLGAHVGLAIPHAAFSSDHGLGFGGRLDGEYFFTTAVAIAAQLGADRFGGKSGGQAATALYAGLALRYYPLQGRLRPFGLLGAELIKLDPGSSAGGAVVGLGAQWLLTHSVALELTYALHGTTHTNPRLAWSDVQLGARYRF